MDNNVIVKYKQILNWRVLIMPVNQMETQLEAITTTIAYLEKHKSCDPEVIEQLKIERERLLRELNVHRI